MPIEVYPIEGPDPSRTISEVADEIRLTYEKVTQNSGTIIAEHTISVGFLDEDTTKGRSYLFLVAHTPEAITGHFGE